MGSFSFLRWAMINLVVGGIEMGMHVLPVNLYFAIIFALIGGALYLFGH